MFLLSIKCILLESNSDHCSKKSEILVDAVGSGLDCPVLLDIHHNDGTDCALGKKIQAVVRQVSLSADIAVFKSELFLKLAPAFQRKFHSSPLHFLTAHLAVLGVK
jgi:hypothetical protein